MPSLDVATSREILAPSSTWDETSDWLDRERSITNSKLQKISSLDTLAASKQLKSWVDQGVLVALPADSRQMARYTKQYLLAGPGDSLPWGLDNEIEKTQTLF